MISFSHGFPGEDFQVRVALQKDFSMNVTPKQQDMIQSAYWDPGCSSLRYLGQTRAPTPVV